MPSFDNSDDDDCDSFTCGNHKLRLVQAGDHSSDYESQGADQISNLRITTSTLAIPMAPCD